MRQARISLLVLLIVRVQLARAVNFDQCLSTINNMTIDGKMDNHGRLLPASTNNATAITYDLCVSQCGADPEPFQWFVFSQQFSSWTLPWLALVSQLPFGAHDALHNFQSMFLTVGSPTLAAYSLALTAFNGRWIAQRFRDYHIPNIESAAKVLHNLQQSPLRIHTDGALLASLIILPENVQWWEELANALRHPHTWSISAATSIAWVVIAYIFTLVDYFLRSPQGTVQTNGGSTGTLWLWLLPIVLGWLHLSPKCDSELLKEAVEIANTHAHVPSATPGPPILVAGQMHAISLDFSKPDYARSDELKTPPIFNYARFLPWVQAVTVISDKIDNVWGRSKQNIPIATGLTLQNRGSDGWNKLTPQQVSDYCSPIQTSAHQEWRLGGSVRSRMLWASLLAVALQWGTAGAAVVIVWFTPTIGLGCRSFSYITYGGISTLVWMMLLASSILTFYSTNILARQQHCGHQFARVLAIGLRWWGKVFAIINVLCLVAMSVAQSSGVYDNCFCNSSVFGLRKSAYNVISLTPDDVTSMKNAWIGGSVLGVGTAVVFVVFVALFVPTFPRTK